MQAAPAASIPFESQVLSHPRLPSWSTDIKVTASNVHDLPSVQVKPESTPALLKKVQVAGALSPQAIPSLSLPLASHVESHPVVPSWSTLIKVVASSVHDLPSVQV